MKIDREYLADKILDKISSREDDLKKDFHIKNRVQSSLVDNLLDEEIARKIFNVFPPIHTMMLKKSIREYKWVAAQMDRFHPMLEEIVYAFQDPRIVSLLSRITGIDSLYPDEELYAGGISAMVKGNFLNPHLDNSHDQDRKRYRVLNLLYYVTPTWQESYGGHLELWDQGPKGMQRTIHSRFNRLVIMLTNRRSWHSVSPVVHDGARCCVSNYYFSSNPADTNDYFHVTSFRGRPKQYMRDIFLQGDIFLRNTVRKFAKKGFVRTKHIYRK